MRSLPPFTLANPFFFQFSSPHIYSDTVDVACSLSVVLVLGSSSFVLCGFGLVDDTHHLLLQVLSLHRQAVLVPDKVWRAQFKVVAFHATLEQ